MKKFLHVVAITLGVLTYASASTAVPILAGVINGVLFCATDNNTLCSNGIQLPDFDPTPGSLLLTNNTLGGVTVNSSTHTETIAGAQNSLNSQSLQIINTTGAAVAAEVAVGGINFTGPILEILLSGSGTWQNAGGSTIGMDWYADAANSQGGQTPSDTPGTLLHSFGDTATPGVDSFATGTVAIPFPAAGPFSMTTHFTMNLAAGGQLISRGQNMIAEPQAAVPDAAQTMGLLLAAMFSLAIVRQRSGAR